MPRHFYIRGNNMKVKKIPAKKQVTLIGTLNNETKMIDTDSTNFHEQITLIGEAFGLANGELLQSTLQILVIEHSK